MEENRTVLSRAAAGVLLAVVLAGAFAIRFRGVGYGLPAITRQDEILIMNVAFKMVSKRDADPHFFIYPSLFLYMQAGLLEAQLAWGRSRGVCSGLDDADKVALFLAGRYLTIALALATVLALYFIGALLFGRAPGLLAALILALCPLHVANSVYNSVDAPMTFWVVLAFLQAALIQRRGPKWRYYVLGAVFAGCAMGTKYNAVVIVLPLLVAHFQAHPLSWRAAFHRKLLAAGLLTALTFLATTPYLLLRFGEFREGIRYFTQHYAEGHLGATAAWVSHPQYAGLLVHSLGAWFTLLALAAAAWLIAREPRKGILVAAYPLAFFLMLGMYRAYFSRNLLSLIPFLALLAASAVAALARSLRRAVGGARPARPLLAAAAALALLLSAASAVQLGCRSWRHVVRTTLPDTRLEAERWIEANLPARSRIVLEKYGPRLGRGTFRTRRVQFALSAMSWKELAGFDYVVTSSHTYDRFFADRKRYAKEAGFYEELFARGKCLRAFVGDDVRATGPTLKVLRPPRQ